MAQPPTPEELARSITSDDILGKDVIDPDGAFIGIVEKVHIDAQTLDFIGVSVDKGLLKKGLVIGKDYIHSITSHAVFLKIRPTYNLKGMIVFDIEGKKLGTVTDVVLQFRANKLKSLVVRSGIMAKKEIPSSWIKSVGDNIFLNRKKEEVLEKD